MSASAKITILLCVAIIPQALTTAGLQPQRVSPPPPPGMGEMEQAYHQSTVNVQMALAAKRQPYAAGNVPQWGRFEVAVTNVRSYDNPYMDVTLDVTFTKPDGTLVEFWGFYDGDNCWRIRFLPDQVGMWQYVARFSDGADQINGSFNCVESDFPGMIAAYEPNPIWFGLTGGKPLLIRSFHVGDRFLADGDNPLTGQKWSPSRRKAFLDWAQGQGYNTLSIAGCFLKRNVKGRGLGWSTPNLWDSANCSPNFREYRRLEGVLDDLAARGMFVYPFAGLFGRESDFPCCPAKQTLFIKYTMARLGTYWNLLWMVGGPEPLMRSDPYLSRDQINRMGRTIAKADCFGHLISVHNPTGPDVFVDADWASYSILQGPKTRNRQRLSDKLLEYRSDAKPLYAQETLWPGNIYHPHYLLDDVRKNAFVMMLSGASINFADMDGNSSSGFSGSMDPADRVQSRHDVIKKVWDFFEGVPFWKMSPHQDLVDAGYCLAQPGRCYLVYLEHPGDVNIAIESGDYRVQWINAQDTDDVHPGGVIEGKRTTLTSPQEADDWLLSLTRVEP